MEIPYLPKFFLHPTLLDQVLKPFQPAGRTIVRLKRLVGSIRRKHAGLEREMNPFQPHGIQETGGIADDHSAIEVVLRLSPIPSFGNGLRAVRIESAAFKNASYIRMGFEFLEPLVRIQP